jgi:CheY-like chemotaxis protein
MKVEKAPAMARILLVEDNEAIRELVALRLEIAGHEMTLAENGKVGLDTALATTPDLILMDMHMPVMSGYEAVKELRANGYAGPIVALTASAISAETSDALDSGCDSVITKPVTTEFESQVADIIKNHGNP